MGRQESIIKFKGRMGELSFSKTRNGFMARKASGIDGERILNDPSYQRTRWNMAEFGHCASGSSNILRLANYHTSKVKDRTCFNRLTQVLSSIKNLDIEHPRGQRTVMGGLKIDKAVDLFLDFSFNSMCDTKSILQTTMLIDKNTGGIVLKDFNPDVQILKPVGSDKAGFNSIWIQVDLDGQLKEKLKSTEVIVDLKQPEADVEIALPGTLTEQGLNLLILQTAFYTEDGRKDLLPFNDSSMFGWSIVAAWMT